MKTSCSTDSLKVLVLEKTEAQTVIMALNCLGSALTTYNHVWTPEERMLYERAIGLLR